MSVANRVESRMLSYFGSDIRSYSLYITKGLFGREEQAVYVYPAAYGDLTDVELDKYSILIVVGNEVVKDHKGLFGVGYKFV